MFGFGKKSKAPRWSDLTSEQQRNVTARIAHAVKAMSGARYKVVSGFDEFQRERGQIERHGEDEILGAYARGRMLDLTRNAARNSSTFNGILKQFDLNAVGTKGGKAIFNFGERQKAADAVKMEFAKWTRSADFFDGMSFNTMLKLILKTYIIGGDMVLLFDDGLVEDSGKLLIYEPDEIGNTTEDALKKKFGKYAHQSLGRVYNANARFIGVIVSRSQRGKEEFDPAMSYFLQRDPDASMFDSKWLMPRNVFREAQGRGISPMSSSLATVLDLEDLCGFELAAAKKNSQVIAQILQNPTQEEAYEPSAFESDVDFSNMTDDEIKEAVKLEQQTSPQTVSLDKVASAGVLYQVMPENFKMELLDTKHPNNSIPEFIKFLAGRSAAPFGLTQQYATLCSTGADFKSQQLMTQPVFEEAQKFLEQICDWSLYRWAMWADKRGVIDVKTLGDNWLANVSWSWNRMNELDEQAYQNATQMKLKNMTGSYNEFYGSDWKEKLQQVKEEIDWCKENGLPHPAYNMVSGGERTGANVMPDGTKIEGN